MPRADVSRLVGSCVVSVERPNKVCELQQDHADLVIAPASLEDLDAIVRIEQASFSAPWTRKMIQAELIGNPFATFLVGRHPAGTSIVGYVCYWLVFEELRVMTLAVDPPVRRRGIAMALVRYALQDGQNRGAKRAVLEVRASNVSAQNLYARFGFRQVAVRERYYTNPIEDAMIMELEPIQSQAEVETKVE